MNNITFFNKIGLLVVDQNNRILLVRKDNYTSKLLMPGGQIEEGENDLSCLNREISEELGEVSISNPILIDTYEDKAASDDPNRKGIVSIKLFSGNINGEPKPLSEIIELIWFSPQSNQEELSPIIKNKILPDLIEKEILSKEEWGSTI